MAIPSAGAISVRDLNLEIGYSAGRQSAFNDPGFDILRASSGFPYALEQFYGITNRILGVDVFGASTRIGYKNTYDSSTAYGTIGATTEVARPSVLNECTQGTAGNITPFRFQIDFAGAHPQNYFTSVFVGQIGGTNHILTSATVTGFTQPAVGGSTFWFWDVGSMWLTVGQSYYLIFH